jgi:hypothetical protein
MKRKVINIREWLCAGNQETMGKLKARSFLVLLLFVASFATIGTQTDIHAVGGAKLVVTNTFWGTTEGAVSAHPGDPNIPLTVLLTNAGDDFARDVNATLIVQPPFAYTYYVGEQRFTSQTATKSAGDIAPGVSFPLLFTLSIDANSPEGIHRLTLVLSYKSARELTPVSTSISLDVPVWRGELKIQRYVTLPLKVYPGDTQVNLKVWIGNTGIGSTKNLELRLDLNGPLKPSSSGSDRFLVGVLPPGATAEVDFFIDIAEDATFGNRRLLVLAVEETSTQTTGEIDLFISEKAALRVVDVSPSTLGVGETGVSVKVTIRNTGSVKAEAVSLQLKVGNFFTGTLTDYLGAIDPGTEKAAFLTVDVDSSAKAAAYNVDVRLDWTQENNSLDQTLTITLNVEERPVSPALIGGVIAIVVIAIGAYWYRRRRRAKEEPAE